ncbi:DUF2842 domain-containing protein [Roseomonas alkaliterrae]|uniref:DUF2842 domain-containing protein n=1 Tax=Neoroseomonas alkaliterrae TaxID=1452450 RepID=A0A840Y7J6_9PROT|nr:DUF2842 domain-containing protein [Neoroseomonas alkaliterrae]MBB5690552.1 hypothetical protein [Neoroseomonas alkaliterrae]MBR0678176.1 DUF2842 domain-containing protein [Neoroseomonas alkaliterrae]
MSRRSIALLAGTGGFLAYVVLVLLLADHVLGLHWTLEFLFFAVAGIAWVWPAKWLIAWALR